MALIYRAIWEESRPDLPVVAAAAWQSWLTRKRLPTTPGESENLWTVTGGDAEGTLRTATVDGVRAFQGRLVENRVADGERWTTTFIALERDEPRTGVFWVDVERVSSDPFERFPFRTPRLVRDLIDEGQRQDGDPRVGQVRLTSAAHAIESMPLAGLITNPERRLPLIVFSHDPDAGEHGTLARANEALARLAGVAQVFVLPPSAIDAFKDRVGEELGVWGGAARLYLPNTGPSGMRPERHRYVPKDRVARNVGAAGDEFVTLLSASVPATAPPPTYEVVRRELAGASDSKETAALYDEMELLLGQIEALRADVARMDEERMELLDANDVLESELNRKSGMVERIVRAAMPDAGRAESAELPDEVHTLGEVLLLADKHLPHVMIDPNAPRDIDLLDSAVESRGWANSSWRALRALDAYATNDEGIAGGFWEWCQLTASPWAWPATPKKLAMTESETVLNNDALRRCRLLPIDAAVNRGGKIEMFAHLKIAEGGGPRAPRIYFHDDRAGTTGKVHVGYIGPHEHLPNTRTN